MGLYKKKAVWIKQEHLWGKATFMCSHCKAVYTEQYQFCPKCKYEMKKRSKYDPTWIDEMQDYD